MQYTNPYQYGAYVTPQPTPSPQPVQTPISVDRVAGIEAAKNYYVLPGNTVFLIDETNMMFYKKSTDLSGVQKPMESYHLLSDENYQKIQNGSQNSENFVTKEEFEKYVTEADKKFVIRRKDK